jgi:hypothetical protein
MVEEAVVERGGMRGKGPPSAHHSYKAISYTLNVEPTFQLPIPIPDRSIHHHHRKFISSQGGRGWVLLVWVFGK